MEKKYMYGIIFMLILIGVATYNTTNWIIKNEVPLPWEEPEQEEYISYEEGGQQYGIDAQTMVEMIDVVANR